LRAPPADDVLAGEICALIGPNGAGKSSLLNVISGVYRADGGEIRFAGETLTGAKPLTVARLGISRTFQHNALFRQLSMLDNVMAGLTRQGSTNIFEHALGLPRARAEEREFRKTRFDISGAASRRLNRLGSSVLNRSSPRKKNCHHFACPRRGAHSRSVIDVSGLDN
jgi:ABC-type branched-subunit amino acid transport system ATPase component